MQARRAALVFTEGPDDIPVGMPGGGHAIALDPEKRLVIQLGPAELPEDAYGVNVSGKNLEKLYGMGWSGRKNSAIVYEPARGWVVLHMGHTNPFHVNGEPVYRDHVLSDGDRIEPAIGLVFTFVETRGDA